MTRDEILNMPAGTEMDLLVNDFVIDNKYPDNRCPVCGWLYEGNLSKGCVLGNCCMRPVPHNRADKPYLYSTDIAAAWDVVEKFKEHFEHIYFDKGAWSVIWEFNKYDGAETISAETFPLAICRAALLAVMETEAKR